MNWLAKLIMALIVPCVILELALGPGVFLFAGLLILVLVWLSTGGLMGGNPYKRMYTSSQPDFAEVGQYMMDSEINNKDTIDSWNAVPLYCIGLCLILIDAFVFWALGKL